MAEVFRILPDRHTVIHGDCHPGNVMVSKGEYLFIDISSCSMGHPVIDLASMAMIYKLPTLGNDYENIRKGSDQLKNLSKEEAMLLWNTFIRTYLDTADKTTIGKAEQQIIAYAALRVIQIAITVPGLMGAESIKKTKPIVLGYCSNLQPLCF